MKQAKRFRVPQRKDYLSIGPKTRKSNVFLEVLIARLQVQTEGFLALFLSRFV